MYGGGITYISDIYIKQGNLSGVKARGCYVITVWHCHGGKRIFTVLMCSLLPTWFLSPSFLLRKKHTTEVPLAITVFLRCWCACRRWRMPCAFHRLFIPRRSLNGRPPPVKSRRRRGCNCISVYLCICSASLQAALVLNWWVTLPCCLSWTCSSPACFRIKQ